MEVKIIEDSISHADKRLTTMQLKYPRFIHAEFMTHRVFSRNASSSRAVPVAKMIEQVKNAPAKPIHWGKNQPGMQAREELEGNALFMAKSQWLDAAYEAARIAQKMTDLGLHKQVANRILEPFQFIHVVVTSTEWENFFELRCHKDAQPEIQALAVAMRDAMEESKPVLRAPDSSSAFNWHLPYIMKEERVEHEDHPVFLARVSTARCARVSYMKHDGTKPSLEEDIDLFERLVGSEPLHASPCEHQAWPTRTAECPSGNFFGWHQFRKMVETWSE